MKAAQDPLIHTLFSCKSSFNVAPPPPRKSLRPSGGEVPKNTEGLRLLAAEGSWIDLLDLAQNLERELVRANQQNTANSAQMQKQNYIDGAVLQLMLTRITAYVKMNDFGRAVQVIQSVPFDKIPEQEVPFSLSFLKSFLPTLLSTSSPNQVAAAQNALYSMLSKLEGEIKTVLSEQQQGLSSSSKKSSQQQHDPIALLEHRRFRVARGLFVCHLKNQEIVTAITLLQTLARYHAERKDRLVLHLKAQTSEFSENIFSTSPVVTRASSDFSSSQKMSLKSAEHLKRLIETSVMEQLQCLQQALSLSLYAANAPLAHFLRKCIENLDTKDCSFGKLKQKKGNDSSSSSRSCSSDEDEDASGADPKRIAANKKSEVQHLKELTMCLNDSLIDTFFDRPADAASRLCNVVGTFLLDPDNNVLPPSLRNLGKYGNITNASYHEETSSTGSSMILPFYLEPSRSIHVQHQFLSICLTLIALVPHTLHAPPSAASQRAPAFVESKRPQSSAETAQLCNNALDRLATAVPHVVLRMPGFHSLVSEIRQVGMTDGQATSRKQVYQSVLSYLVAGRESVGSLC